MRLPRQPEQTFIDNLSRYAGVSEAGACRRNPERQRRVWLWAVMQAWPWVVEGSGSEPLCGRDPESSKGWSPQAKSWSRVLCGRTLLISVYQFRSVASVLSFLVV